MIHGGSQTGTNFTGTPDGREGWAQYFLRRGHAVYVVDQVARGRSAHFSQSQGPVQAANLKRTEQRFVAPKRFNLWPQAKKHTQWPGSRQAGRCRFRCVLRHAISLARQLSQAAGAQPRRRHRAARPHRTCDPAGAFAVRRVRLADRRCAAAARQGDRGDRAQRPAGVRDRVQGRARLVRRHRPAQDLWPRHGAAHLRPAAQARRRARIRAPARSPMRPAWCAAGCRRSRRASFRTSPRCRS